MPHERNTLIHQIAEAEVSPFRRSTPAHMHDDLMQEAMIGAWRALERLDGDRTPKEQKAWLGRAARSKVIDFLRYTAVRRRELPSTPLLVHGEKPASGSDLLDVGMDAPNGLLVAAAHAIQERAGNAARPDDMVEAGQLARRIQQAVGMTLDSLTPEARLTVEARLGLGEAPPTPRRRRDEHVRVARERLTANGHAVGLQLDLGVMIACQ